MKLYLLSLLVTILTLDYVIVMAVDEHDIMLSRRRPGLVHHSVYNTYLSL